MIDDDLCRCIDVEQPRQDAVRGGHVGVGVERRRAGAACRRLCQVQIEGRDIASVVAAPGDAEDLCRRRPGICEESAAFLSVFERNESQRDGFGGPPAHVFHGRCFRRHAGLRAGDARIALAARFEHVLDADVDVAGRAGDAATRSRRA